MYDMAYIMQSYDYNHTDVVEPATIEETIAALINNVIWNGFDPYMTKIVYFIIAALTIGYNITMYMEVKPYKINDKGQYVNYKVGEWIGFNFDTWYSTGVVISFLSSLVFYGPLFILYFLSYLRGAYVAYMFVWWADVVSWYGITGGFVGPVLMIVGQLNWQEVETSLGTFLEDMKFMWFIIDLIVAIAGGVPMAFLRDTLWIWFMMEFPGVIGTWTYSLPGISITETATETATGTSYYYESSGSSTGIDWS
jgi:hypothetical protein